MRKLLSYIRILLTAGVALVYYNLRYFRKFSRHPEKYPLDYRYKTVRRIVIYVLKVFRVDFETNGLNNLSDLQKKKCLIVSNHHSDADPLIMIATHEEPVTFMAKKEAFKYPIAGNGLRSIGAFSIDRENLMNQIGQIRDIVAHLKDESKPNLIVYIEGTRNRHPEDECLPFHAGTLKIAKMANVPVLPMAIYGTSRILSRKSYLKRYPAFTSYLTPLEYAKFENFDSNTEAVNLKKTIDDELDRIRQIDLDKVNAQKISRKRKALETIIDIKRLP